MTGQVRAPAPSAKAAAPTRPRARVSAIARDGSRSADFVLTKDETHVGRQVEAGEVKLDKDPFIAPLHAVFRFEGPQLMVQDAGTANGVFLWLKERALESGDELRIGRQRLRVEWMPDEPEQLADQPVWGSPNPGYTARVVQLLEGGGEGDVYPLKPGDNLVGRGTGDVSFPNDGYVSSKHATITVGEGSLAVKDLGSANGTFVRVNGQAAVTAGDLLLVGEQILRIDPA
jgi:pSer/pThr/pTyr-binding forkhead associated (FHA) protein